jgi:hypothetical protein
MSNKRKIEEAMGVEDTKDIQYTTLAHGPAAGMSNVQERSYIIHYVETKAAKCDDDIELISRQKKTAVRMTDEQLAMLIASKSRPDSCEFHAIWIKLGNCNEHAELTNLNIGYPCVSDDHMWDVIERQHPDIDIEYFRTWDFGFVQNTVWVLSIDPE